MVPWKIWVDTGGTFTDCIAHTPNNTIKRLKVLSSGVLKGKVIRQKKSQALEVQLHWPVNRDIFNRFSITFFDKKKINARIEKVDLEKSIIYLSGPVKKLIKAGTTFEIFSEEEVPVFAARLLTETGFNQSFPTIEMKLGSTRGTNAPGALAPPPAWAVAGVGAGAGGTRGIAPRLVAHADEQRGHMFAVLMALAEHRQQFDGIPLGRQLDAHGERLAVARTHRADGVVAAHADLIDDTSTQILETAQESARAEQTPEAALATPARRRQAVLQTGAVDDVDEQRAAGHGTDADQALSTGLSRPTGRRRWRWSLADRGDRAAGSVQPAPWLAVGALSMQQAALEMDAATTATPAASRSRAR